MNSLISQITSTSSPFAVVILAIFITFLVIKELYTAVKWVKDRFDGYHNIQNHKEDVEEEIDRRIQTLEQHDGWQYKKLNELGDQVKEVIGLIKEIQVTQSKMIIDTYKGSIFRIYHDSQKNKYISQTELDRFIDLCTIYKAAGGDGVVDEKIYPEVMSLPINND